MNELFDDIDIKHLIGLAYFTRFHRSESLCATVINAYVIPLHMTQIAF